MSGRKLIVSCVSTYPDVSTPADVSGACVAQGIEEILPRAVPVRPLRRMRKGRSHISWLLDTAEGLVLGKVAVRPPSPAVAERLDEHRRAGAHGVPVPRLLAWTEASPPVGGRMLLACDYLPGLDAEELLPRLSQEQRAGMMRQAGAALARLHRVSAPGFGDPASGVGTGPDTWDDYVAGRLTQLRHHHAEAGTASIAWVAEAISMVERLAARVSPWVRPALVHHDVYLPNLLAGDDGEFVALLDLEHLRRVDPVTDFVKPAMWVFEFHPELAEPFREGYRAVNGWPQDFEQRFALVMGLELLTGIPYWRQVGDRTMADDYLHRLRCWLARM